MNDSINEVWRIDNEEYLERGSLDDRYQIYLGCIEGTGQPVKTYDEWLSC